jgi:uncharacterized iron-regulated membrane protein
MATIAAPSRPAAKPRKASRVWWHVHQWVGLKLAIFMSFICLTGTLAVLSSEIDWLLQPSLRVAPSTVEEAPRWDRIAASAAEWPTAATVESLGAPVAGAFAATAVIKRADGTLRILHIHPATGEVQGEATWVGAQRVLRNMHRHLNLPVKYGVPIVCTLAFLLLVSLVTSLVVYKRWWRGFFRPVRWRDARTAWGDLHRLAGVWSLWFVLLIALTGAWYFVEQLGLEAPPMREAAAPATPTSAPTEKLFAANLEAAQRAMPGLRIERILLPQEEGDVFEFQGQLSAWLVRERANSVMTDPATARVLVARTGEELNAHQRISEMADPLHFGYAAGYWTKLPWFLFGLAMTGLSVSGIAIYGLRVGREMPGAGAIAVAWRGMGRWRWLALAAVLTGFALLPALFAQGG